MRFQQYAAQSECDGGPEEQMETVDAKISATDGRGSNGRHLDVHHASFGHGPLPKPCRPSKLSTGADWINVRIELAPAKSEKPTYEFEIEMKTVDPHGVRGISHIKSHARRFELEHAQGGREVQIPRVNQDTNSGPFSE